MKIRYSIVFGIITLLTAFILPGKDSSASFSQKENPQKNSGNIASESFDHDFKNPQNQYRIIQYHMNKDIDEVEIEKLKSYGIGGIQHSVAWNKKYLEDEAAWQKLAENVNKAKNAGFQVWIHDEKGYPSGAAGGLVVRNHPELENKGLVRITYSGEGSESKEIRLPDSIEFVRASLSPLKDGKLIPGKSQTINIKEGTIQTNGLPGKWQLSVFGLKLLDKNTQAQQTIAQFGQTGHYPNLLNRESTKSYINLTHQGYASHIQDIGKKVAVFYTGEPNLMTTWWRYDGSKSPYPYIPWETTLPEVFKRQHGYDLVPFLDALFEGDAESSKTVRLHFYQTVGSMFTDNYVKPITGWCEKNGVQSLGHLLLEEYMALHVIYYGDMMRALRNFHVPACDIPIPKDDSVSWEFWMPKFISSAAYLGNRPLVTALLDPIIGGNGRSNLSPDLSRLKKTINMAYMSGVNQISTYIPYEKYSPGDYKWFNEYVGRLSVMLRGSKNEATIAMYYPIETFQANYIPSPEPWNKIIRNYENLQKPLDRLAASLLRTGLDFNYLTADVLLRGKIREGYLEAGTHRYYSIVLPHVQVVPLIVLKKLKECSQAGIQVLWVDALPSMGITAHEHEKVKKLVSSFEICEQPIDELKNVKNPGFHLTIQSDKNQLTVGKYSRGDDHIYFIVNDSGSPSYFSVKSGKSKAVKLYNPVDGSIREEVLPLKTGIGSYESLFVVESGSERD